MTLVLGTNCGFVTVAPTSDPGGAATSNDGLQLALRDITSAGVNKITEIGWWCGNSNNETNFEVGIYSHNSGDDEPDTLIGVYRTNAKGTTSGWKKVAVDIDIEPSTTYWIGHQVDETNTAVSEDFRSTAGKVKFTTGETTLATTWPGVSSQLVAIWGLYAVEENVAEGTNAQINIGDDWKAIEAAQINIGDTWKAVEGMQVNIGDAWKTIF